MNKKLKNNPLEDTAVLSQIAQQASKKAIKEIFSAGMTIYYIAEGKLIKEYPDGRKESIKELSIKPMRLCELLNQKK